MFENEVEGLNYGYHNFLASWIDTLDKNFPVISTHETMEFLFSLVSKVYSPASDLMVTEFINRKIGTQDLNLTLQQAIAEAARKGKSFEEIIAMPEKEGIEYCEKCKKILCEICKDYHKDFIEGHKTVSINLLNINNCNIHLGKKLNLFCENCELNICSECQNNKHKDHNVICLNDYWKKINDKLTFNCVEELKEKLETEKKNFERILNNTNEKINNFYFRTFN